MVPVRREETVSAHSRLVTRTKRLPAPPQPQVVLAAAAAPRTFWAAPTEATIVGSGAAATLTAAGPDRFRDIRQSAKNLFAAGDVHAGALAARPRLFGGFAFHDAYSASAPWQGYPAARFVLPHIQVTYTDEHTWLTVNTVVDDASADSATSKVDEHLEDASDHIVTFPARDPSMDPPGVQRRARTTSHAEWRDSVTKATDRIAAGELQKVVLAQALETELAGSLSIPAVLARLGDTYPNCSRFLFEPEDGAAGFFGATPEQLVGLRGRTVETGVLAGTTGRGDTPTEDEWLADELLADEKNVHEHDLVTEAIADQLEPYTASIQTGPRGIRRLATVQHIHTPIAAELAADEHVLTLVEALHPTPAVGGLPPDEARRTITDTEPFERGWYAAPVGWFDAAGYGSFAVALRSAIARDDMATLFAGVGIVADSDPDREWDEVQLKYRPILDELE